MTEPLQPDASADAAMTAEAGRSADHAAIERLATDLLPALIAKLGATGLGELEVRQDGWKIRLRRPADGALGRERRSGAGAARSQPGHAGHGHGPVPVEGHRPARAVATSTNGTSPGPLVPVGPGPDPATTGTPSRQAVATSPAVGIYRQIPEAGAGRRVRAGDRIGFVDMLGVPQEVVAPVDGVLGESLAETGEAVEYGQELIVIQFATSSVGEG